MNGGIATDFGFLEETLAALHSDAPNDEQLAATTEGIQCLIAVLMLATG
jgi:hypothetical protein